MHDTGLLRRPVASIARRILFDRRTADGWDEVVDVLRLSARIDKAHLIMLAERDIVASERVRPLLRAIADLERNDFVRLRGQSMPRGIYLLYEDHLIEQLGTSVAGVLQTARSRNDLNATILRLQIRRPYLALTGELLRLVRILLRRAARHIGTVMPLYTHGQPGMPSTYAHYLTGVACACLRDIRGITDAARDLQVCPLGACAGAGTSWPIDMDRTATLLGFRRPCVHSVDAVASRDLVLRLLAAAAISAVTLSRLATDLLQWTTMEFGFFDLPDSVVGSSSAMPQKRNPFLLEHVQGKAAHVLGACQAAMSAMHATPFTNSIAVGAEGVRPLWDALEELAHAATLVRLVVAAARPRPERMLASAVAGFTTATITADRLVRERGMDFRSAHALVGRTVSAAPGHSAGTVEQNALGVDPVEAVGMLAYGNGPAPLRAQATIASLDRLRRTASRRRAAQRRAWDDAGRGLEETAARFS